MSDKTEFTITTKRFRELIDNVKYKDISRAEIAKATDCDTSTITKYYNGQRQLSVDSVIKFAKYFNVSSDYLLGLTNAPTVLNSSDEKALRICCDYTNLSENSIEILHWLKFVNLKGPNYKIDRQNINDPELISFVNQLIEFVDDNLMHLQNYFYALNHLKKVFNDPDFIKIQKEIDDDFEVLVSERCYPHNLHLQVAQYNLTNAFNALINNEETKKILKSSEYYISLLINLDKKKESKQIDE